jgi:hypothetical protein
MMVMHGLSGWNAAIVYDGCIIPFVLNLSY